jgi:hypothetical protein
MGIFERLQCAAKVGLSGGRALDRSAGYRGYAMTQHFTRRTVAATLWCGKCQRPTLHRITDRRKDACLECVARLEALHNEPRKPEAEKQQELFA